MSNDYFNHVGFIMIFLKIKFFFLIQYCFSNKYTYHKSANGRWYKDFPIRLGIVDCLIYWNVVPQFND